MASQGRPLPKFGEWDVNNPASAEGFTVIFNKARDDKKIKNSPAKVVSPRITEPVYNKDAKHENYKHPPKIRGAWGFLTNAVLLVEHMNGF